MTGSGRSAGQVWWKEQYGSHLGVWSVFCGTLGGGCSRSSSSTDWPGPVYEHTMILTPIVDVTSRPNDVVSEKSEDELFRSCFPALF